MVIKYFKVYAHIKTITKKFTFSMQESFNLNISETFHNSISLKDATKESNKSEA